MILSTIAHWYGAARSALRAMLFGLPAPGENPPIGGITQDQSHDSQRGMVASRLAKMQRGRPSDNAQICAVSQDQAAELLNVSERTDLVEIPTKLSQAEAAELERGMVANRLAKMRQGERTDLSGIPPRSQPQAAEMERGANQHRPIGLPSQEQAAEIAPAQDHAQSEPACQPPESTPGSFNWIRTHNFAATDRDLQCADCGMRWPEAPQEPHT